LSEYVQELVKVTCTQCKRYKKCSPDVAKKFEDDPESFHCEICWKPEGVHRLVQNLIECNKCHQVCTKSGPTSFCMCKGEPIKSGIQITFDPKGAWTKGRTDTRTEKIQHDIEEGKQEWKFKKSVRALRVEELERDKRMDSNLQRIADSLDNKETSSPV